MTPLPPFAKLARAVNTSTLVLTHFPHLTDNSRLLLVGASQFCWCYLSSYQQPTGWSKVTAVSSRMSQQQCTSQFCGGQGEQSADHSLQGHVPMAVEADLSPSPAASILNSLSGWNIQEALEEWIIHSLVLLPMDLCFLVPMRHSVFVLTVIGDVCASFDDSWGHAISSICSTRSNSTIHHSACQTRLSSEALRAASLTKRLDSFQGSVQQQQPSREAADTCFVITLQHWPEPYCSADDMFWPTEAPCSAAQRAAWTHPEPEAAADPSPRAMPHFSLLLSSSSWLGQLGHWEMAMRPLRQRAGWGRQVLRKSACGGGA